MSEKCDFRLAADIAANCSNKTVKGMNNEGFIMNYADIDWDSCTKDNDNPNLYTAIVLKSGKKAYNIYVPGSTPYTGTKSSMQKGTYRNTFNRDVPIVILDNGPEVAHNIIDQLANGQFVVILENKFKGTDGKNTFQVYGIEAGLTASAIDDDKYSDDTEGGWLATLQEVGAPSSAIYFFKDSIAATRTALQSLVAGSTGA